MAKVILVFLFIIISPVLYADFFGSEAYKSKIPGLVEKLKGIDQSSLPSYEDQFNLQVKSIENAVEEEKLVCSGEATDAAGKLVSKDKKQLCFRELKNNYLEASDVIFSFKKKYLELIHSRQIERLTEIQKKLKADIEKGF